MIVHTTKNPAWLNRIAPEEFNDDDLFRIVIFYVFHSPCTELSAMGKSLSEYGWSNPWSKPFYLNKQMKQASSNSELLYSADKYENMSQALQKSDLYEDFPRNLTRERICVYDNKKNQFMSVFYHLRNAFAHGRINFADVEGECVFILEDVQPNKKNINNQKVSARMILRKSTLLKWIEIIENGEKEYQKTIEQ